MADYFERREMKYLLDEPQMEILTNRMAGRMERDAYSPYSVFSAYLDLPDDELMKRNLDRPAYRRKVRIRCYGPLRPQAECFLETKNKLNGITVKKRTAVSLCHIEDFLERGSLPEGVAASFLNLLETESLYRIRYGIQYDREAFFWKSDPDLRITFDRNICVRLAENEKSLLLLEKEEKRMLLPSSKVLMEIKTGRALPLELARTMSALHLVPVSFSKAGASFLLCEEEKERKGPKGGPKPKNAYRGPGSDLIPDKDAKSKRKGKTI